MGVEGSFAVARAEVPVAQVTVHGEGGDLFRTGDLSSWNGFGADIDITLGTIFMEAAKDRETAVDRLLFALPLNLHRSGGRLYLYGTLNGFKVEVSAGDGVCEIVQVGTRVEQQPDPEYIAAAPVIDVEVPVFERRCPDPLAVS